MSSSMLVFNPIAETFYRIPAASPGLAPLSLQGQGAGYRGTRHYLQLQRLDGNAGQVPVSIGVEFYPVPEPSGFMLLVSGWLALVAKTGHNRRNRAGRAVAALRQHATVNGTIESPLRETPGPSGTRTDRS
jgi:hypothetical protein